MKKLLLVVIISVLGLSCNVDPQSSKEESSSTQADFEQDADLISKYSADEYGMKKYVMAFLKKGPNRNHDSATVASIQRAHLDNIEKMANEGKLVLAGPFLDDSDIRGIYIFNVETIEEAERLTSSDPAIKEGRLIMELRPWYGSAALMEVNNLHNKIARKKV